MQKREESSGLGDRMACGTINQNKKKREKNRIGGVDKFSVDC